MKLWVLWIQSNARGLPKAECFGRRPKILKIRLQLRPPKVLNFWAEGVAEGLSLMFKNALSNIFSLKKIQFCAKNFISVHLLKHQFPFDFQGSFYIHLNLSTRGMRYEKQLSETILQTSLNFHENKKQKLATKNY